MQQGFSSDCGDCHEWPLDRACPQSSCFAICVLGEVMIGAWPRSYSHCAAEKFLDFQILETPLLLFPPVETSQAPLRRLA